MLIDDDTSELDLVIEDEESGDNYFKEEFKKMKRTTDYWGL